MSVVKQPNGTWIVKYYKRDPIKNKLVSTTKRGFATKREAQKFEVENKDSSVNCVITFKKLYDEYLLSLKCAPKAIDERKHYRDTYIKQLCDTPMWKINKPMLMNWWSDLKTNSGLAPATINTIIGLVKGTFKYANEVYDVKDISIILKKVPLNRGEKEILTVDEFNRFIECEPHPIYKAFFYTAYWTGCRRGELRALEKKDLKDGYLLVRQSMRFGEESIKTGTKTSKMYKKVYLDDETYKMLLPLAQRKGKYLFGDDTYLSNETLRRRLRIAMQKAGIDKNITLHCFRHSHGSVLLANGVDIATVSKRLGHASITTTLENYIHILDDNGQVTIDAINKIKGIA